MYEYGENFIDDNKLSLVWNEIQLIYPAMLEADRTGSAIVNGVIAKKGKGFLSENWVAKMVTPNIVSIIDSLEKNFKFSECNSLVNYYDDGDYYGPHTDTAIKTLIIPLCRPDSKFEGGEFVLEDKVIPFKHNSYILFDSKMKHEVRPIKIINQGPMMGRFSLTYFFI